jgi:hypothetical protein
LGQEFASGLFGRMRHFRASVRAAGGAAIPLADANGGSAVNTAARGVRLGQRTRVRRQVGSGLDHRRRRPNSLHRSRLAPMIRDTKVLRDLFGDAKSRDAGSTLTHKQFPGGAITVSEI